MPVARTVPSAGRLEEPEQTVALLIADQRRSLVHWLRHSGRDWRPVVPAAQAERSGLWRHPLRVEPTVEGPLGKQPTAVGPRRLPYER